MRRAGRDLGQMREAHADVARQVVAATHAPRRSGRLAGSVRPGATQTSALARAGGARLRYAAPIHWGWPARGIRPQPFLVDAAHRTEPAWILTYQAAVARIVDRIHGDR